MRDQTLTLPSVIATLIVIQLLTISGGHVGVATAQDKPAPADRAARPVIRVPTALTLEEARVIVEAAKAVVKAENGRAAIAVVDFNGNLISSGLHGRHLGILGKVRHWQSDGRGDAATEHR